MLLSLLQPFDQSLETLNGCLCNPDQHVRCPLWGQLGSLSSLHCHLEAPLLLAVLHMPLPQGLCMCGSCCLQCFLQIHPSHFSTSFGVCSNAAFLQTKRPCQQPGKLRKNINIKIWIQFIFFFKALPLPVPVNTDSI